MGIGFSDVFRCVQTMQVSVCRVCRVWKNWVLHVNILGLDKRGLWMGVS
jgi:hypothetical protein